MDWLRHRARVDPEQTALVHAESGRSWTYGQLDTAVEVLAERLVAEGISPETRVGTLIPRTPTYVKVLWGILRAGGVLVPIDTGEPAGRIAELLDVANVSHLLVDPAFDALGDALAEHDVDIHPTASIAPEAQEITRSAAADSRAGFHDLGETMVHDLGETMFHDLEETMVVLFTSGTTGEPKGVRLTPRNIGTSAAGSAFRLGVDPDDRWLLTLPLYHMGGLSIPLRAAIYGTTVVVERSFDATTTGQRLQEFDVTGVSLVPTMLERLLDAGPIPDSLRFALVGGAPTPEPLAARALDAGVPLYTTYGMTETASQVATATPAELHQDPETVGRPIRTARVEIRPDREAGRSEAQQAGAPGSGGSIGEIAVSGPIVSPGYLGEDPRPPGEPFRTGDIGYIDDAGKLFVTGRQSDLIVTGGENVHPSEVTAAILDLSSVRAAAVVGVPDETWGERVAAVVVPDASGVTEEAIRQALRDRLADYKIPKTIRVVDSLPRTRSGTVDRSAIQEIIVGPDD